MIHYIVIIATTVSGGIALVVTTIVILVLCLCLQKKISQKKSNAESYTPLVSFVCG